MPTQLRRVGAGDARGRCVRVAAIALCSIAGAVHGVQTAGAQAPAPTAVGAPSDSLTRVVRGLDSALFAAYDGCDLGALGALAAEDLEFYHDQTGLSRGRHALVGAVRQNVCGKVRRDLAPGTLAVYPLRGYGALETGEHRFCDPRANRTCTAATGGLARFVMLSRRDEAGGWQLARVISYDHAPRTTPPDRPRTGARGRGL
jgi:hypothetical protein